MSLAALTSQSHISNGTDNMKWVGAYVAACARRTGRLVKARRAREHWSIRNVLGLFIAMQSQQQPLVHTKTGLAACTQHCVLQ